MVDISRWNKPCSQLLWWNINSYGDNITHLVINLSTRSCIWWLMRNGKHIHPVETSTLSEFPNCSFATPWCHSSETAWLTMWPKQSGANFQLLRKKSNGICIWHWNIYVTYEFIQHLAYIFSFETHPAVLSSPFSGIPSTMRPAGSTV